MPVDNEALLRHLGLVDGMVSRGTWEDARRAIDECLAYFPAMRRFQKQRLMSSKALVLIALDDRNGAMNCLECAGAHREDEKVDMLRSLGAQLAHRGLLHEAVFCYDEAVRRKPADPVIRQQQGSLLKRLGRFDGAQAAFSGAADFTPRDDYEEWILKGDLLYDLDRFEEAVECYRRSLDLNPGESYSIYAYSHAKQRIESGKRHMENRRRER